MIYKPEDLPDYYAISAETESPIERLLHEYDPAGEEQEKQWRQMLCDALNEAYEAGLGKAEKLTSLLLDDEICNRDSAYEIATGLCAILRKLQAEIEDPSDKKSFSQVASILDQWCRLEEMRDNPRSGYFG